MKRYMGLVIFCVIVVSIIGCARKDVAKGPLLAKVGDKVITLQEFNDRIAKLPENIKTIAEQNKAAYLDNIVIETLLHQEALRKNLDKDREIKELFEEAKKRIIIARLAKEEVEDKIKVDEKELKDYYQEHKEELMSPELFKASHILVDTLQEAVEIVDKLNAGALFEELAKKHSKDVTNKRGGDIGYFSVGQMVPEFEDACLKLKVGEISGPVKTQFGYHIIKLTDKKESEPLEFDKVKDRIEMILKSEKRRDLFDNLITLLKSKTNLTINAELLEPKPEEMPEETPPAPTEESSGVDLKEE